MLRKLKALWFWLRFGKVTVHVVDTINGSACEIEYRGRNGAVIGYWAYGAFDPTLPYQE